MNDNMKSISIALLIVFAVAFTVYFILIPDTQNVNLNTGTRVNGQTFLYLLSNSSKIYIVQDLRNASDVTIKRNIQQCGIDFASSPWLATNNVTTYAFDSTGCISSEGVLPLSSCVSKLSNGKTIYVSSGSKTEFYTNMMIVGIDKTYTSGSCGLTIK